MATKKEEKLFEKEQKAARKRKKKEHAELFASMSPEEKAYRRKKELTDKVWPIFRFLILFGLCFVILYPLIFMVSTAFRPNSQMNDPTIIWLPKTLTLANIKQVWNSANMLDTLLNTVSLNIVASILQVAVCAITGYGFARFKFKGRGLLFGIVIMMIIVPPQITNTPLFLQFSYFKAFGLVELFTGKPYVTLIDSGLTMYLPALFVNGIRAGLFILLFRQFFKGLPKELEDAAYLDGCGPFKTFIKVMIPNAASSFLTVFLFSIVWYWNDYYISSSYFTQNSTIAISLKNLNTTLALKLFNTTTTPPARELIVWLESGCLIAIAPILIMYVFLQRYFTEGLERSGLVG